MMKNHCSGRTMGCCTVHTLMKSSLFRLASGLFLQTESQLAEHYPKFLLGKSGAAWGVSTAGQSQPAAQLRVAWGSGHSSR